MDSVTEMDALSLAQHVDLLKVAHHGSNTSSSAAWLDLLKPEAAVISVGANNHYHHPSPETLFKLTVRNIPYWRTDQGGAVTIQSDGRYFVVTQGEPHTWLENIRCLLPRELRSSCSPPGRTQSFPASSPTSPPPPRP
jgi:beta-lactamase superfamily II metal-dependent hydrolase